MSGPLGRAFRTVFTGLAFLMFFFYGWVLSWLVLPLVRLFRRDRAEKNRLCRRVVGRSWVFFHDYMRVLRLIDYDPRDVAVEAPDGPFVMVANHPSLIDVTALLSRLPDCAVVVKPALYRSALVGPLLRYCDHIEGGEGGLFSDAGVIVRALERLNAGVPVLIFPEGTRSPERDLHRFRAGAFALASRAGVPLVQGVVTCDPPTLMRGEPWYRVPPYTSQLRVAFLPTLEPPFETSAGQLRLESEERYRTHLEALGAIRRRPGASPHRQGTNAMSTTELELQIKQLLVTSLNLEDVTPESIDSEAPLFVDGLGLDSIDALEIAMALRKQYGIQLQADDGRNREIFKNVKNLAAYVAGQAGETDAA